MTKFMYDLDVGWPRGSHDAHIWSRSQAKRHIELQKRFPGYPISENLVKPYATAESANDPLKRLFNRKLSGARTMMSECLFGVWKARFPILKSLRTAFPLSQKIVLATAVLFNIVRMWEDEEIDDDESLLDELRALHTDLSSKHEVVGGGSSENPSYDGPYKVLFDAVDHDPEWGLSLIHI